MDKSKFNNKKELRKFGIGLTVILSIIATIQIFTGKNLYTYFYAASGVVLLASLTFPLLIKPIFILFSYFGFVMNWVVTRLILSILFYVVFTAISVISRAFGRTFLDVRLDQNAKSYWINKTRIEKESYENQF